MKKTLPTPDAAAIAPSVHIEFIQNQVGLPEAAALEEVEAYHRAVFLHHHAQKLERHAQDQKIHENRLHQLENQLQDVQSKLVGVERLVPVSHNGQPDLEPTAPWNHWDRLMFILSGVGALILMAFGVLNISFNLLESGLVTFVQNPVRSYFWAALLPIGALGVKVGWDFLQTPRLRDRYLWCCLILGVGGVAVWLTAYSTVYPTLSKSTAEHLASLSVFDSPAKDEGFLRGATGGGAKVVDALIVAAQAIAEIFLSATLGIYMTILYQRHRPVVLAGNPVFTQLDKERASLETSIAAERLAMADAIGCQNRLKNELAALIAYARSLFRKEAATRLDQSQQKRVLLDQISEQLRTQLQSFENGTAAGRVPLAPTNGK